jgi:curli biogenesis system outer membrane secretion channel CsgG
MKNWYFVVLVLMVCCLSSCISMQGRQMTTEEKSAGNILGSVSTSWTEFNLFNVMPSKTALEIKAVAKLKEAAKEQGYSGDIDIKNLTVAGSFHIGTLGMFFVSACLFGNFQTVMASGDVVGYNSTGGRIQSGNVEGALERAAEEVAENFTAKSRIAIVYITAENRSQTEYIAGELEHILRRRGFVIIDRSELDRIRTEQKFGMTLEVDDNTAARIGHIAGASIVITGRVDGEGNLRRLRLRALNTENGQVVGTASERL